jgi:hypothetical protein
VGEVVRRYVESKFGYPYNPPPNCIAFRVLHLAELESRRRQCGSARVEYPTHPSPFVAQIRKRSESRLLNYCIESNDHV